MADNEKVGGIAVELEVVLDQASLTRVEGQLAKWAKELSSKAKVGVGGPGSRGGGAAGTGPIPVTLDPAALKAAGKAAGPIPIVIKLDAKNIADQIQAALSGRTFKIKIDPSLGQLTMGGGGGGKKRRTAQATTGGDDEEETGATALPFPFTGQRSSRTTGKRSLTFPLGAPVPGASSRIPAERAARSFRLGETKIGASSRLSTNPTVRAANFMRFSTPGSEDLNSAVDLMRKQGFSDEEIEGALTSKRGGFNVGKTVAQQLMGRGPQLGPAAPPPPKVASVPRPGAGDLPPDIEDVLNKSRARQNKMARSLGMRAISTSIIQMAENAFGGTEEVNRRLQSLQRENQQLEALAKRVGQARKSGVGVTEAEQAFKDQQGEIAKIKGVTAKERVRFLGAGAAGGILGGFVGGATALVAFQALQSAISAASAALGPLVDQMTGFSMTTSKVANAMRDAIRGANGNAGAGLASGSIASGISATFLDQLTASGLGQGATGRAAAQARTEQSDIFRARNASGPNPLYSGTGGFLGSNLFAEQMGGQPGLLERVADDLRNSVSTSMQGGGFGEGPKIIHAPTVDTIRYLDDLNKQLNNAAVSSGKLASEFEFTTKATKAETDAMVASAVATHDQAAIDRAASLRETGVTIRRRGGGGLGVGDFGAAAQQLATGQLQQDPELYFRQQDRAMRAQLGANKATAEFARRTLIPIQTGQGLLQNPENFRNPTAGFTQAEQKQFAPEFSQMQQMQQMGRVRMMAGMNQGVSLLANNGGAQNIPQYVQLNAQIGQYAQQIATIQDELSNKEMVYNVQQYNVQLRQVNRSLADAQALSGQRVKDDGTNLGILERQNFELQKQSQQLGFQASALSQAQSQRQINFQTAIAGFTAPGITGEERYARVQYAKQEAAEAQKQLNIQKEQLALNRRMVSISNQQFERSARRSVVEAKAQRDLLIAAHNLSREQQAKSGLISYIEKQMQPLIAQRDSLVDEATNNYKTIMAAATAAAALFGKSVNEMFDQVSKRYAAFLDTSAKGIVSAVSGIINGYITAIENAFGGGGSYGQTKKGKNPNTGNAQGIIGMTRGTTSAIMGEAGTEAVAILRNPRNVNITGGGGGGAVVININNPSVRNDGDLEKIAKEVERVLNRRSAILGFRRPA